ncbi:MAG: glycine cleavage system protein H [Candidatus Alcyoniella australis]|nr:glycine cleavage system protein H [Candidatus Alcyoniella australis]
MHDLHTFVDYVLYTKYWEYALAFAFMALFLVFYIMLKAPERTTQSAAAREAMPASGRVQGFLVPDDLLYHQGHTWARKDAEGNVLIGVDDFAQRLVGKPSGLKLPAVGAQLRQGAGAWSLDVGPSSFEMVSPVDGEVLAVNPKLAGSTDALKSDPYGDGWLLKVKLPKSSVSLKNLLGGELVKKWTEAAAQRLYGFADLELGAVLSDGGDPVDGMARNLDPQNWEQIVREFFLTD